MLTSSLILALSSRRDVREELLLTVWFWFTVLTSLIRRRQHKGLVLLLQYKLLSLLTGAELLLLLFNLWRLWILLVQTGVPLLVSEKLLLLTDMLLWKLWRNKETRNHL